MDGRRFDTLAKSVAMDATTRRWVIRAIAGGIATRGLVGLLAGGVTLLDRSSVENAKAHNNWSRCKKISKKKRRKKCVKKGKKHKKWHETNACRGEGQNCGDRPCCISLTCQNGICTAAAP